MRINFSLLSTELYVYTAKMSIYSKIKNIDEIVWYNNYKNKLLFDVYKLFGVILCLNLSYFIQISLHY